MFGEFFAGVVALVALAGATLSAEQDGAKKEAPQHVEGTVQKVESPVVGTAYLTVTVREKEPTDREDEMRDVDRERRFRVTTATKLVGMDGKLGKQGVRSLEPRTRVRVEYRDDTAVEVKVLPNK
jgi:hypothetical protein